jgi:hypothetical protein
MMSRATDIKDIADSVAYRATKQIGEGYHVDKAQVVAILGAVLEREGQDPYSYKSYMAAVRKALARMAGDLHSIGQYTDEQWETVMALTQRAHRK